MSADGSGVGGLALLLHLAALIPQEGAWIAEGDLRAALAARGVAVPAEHVDAALAYLEGHGQVISVTYDVPGERVFWQPRGRA